MINKNEIMDIIIIGAGASGLMTASQLDKNKNFIILDINHKIGSKIEISGGGKCNITNKSIESSDYLGNPYFINKILREFNQYQLLKWLKKNNLTPNLRKSGQYFCQNSSKEIINIFKRNIDSKNILLNSKVENIRKREDIFYVECGKKIYRAKSLVVASGGLSFPILGATDIGFKIATSFGHTIKKLSPALVGLTLQKEQFFFKELSGISTEVIVKVDNKILNGSILFAHKGISGIVILNTSLFWTKGEIEVDFLPNFDIELHQNSKKLISNLLPIPKNLSIAFLEYLDIKDISMNKLSKDNKDKLLKLKSYRFAPAGNFGYSKAEVTKGGVSTDEINSKSMMSKKVKNLYFIGEVLDVTGKVGGYNFQWAFSSASVCANNLKGI